MLIGYEKSIEGLSVLENDLTVEILFDVLRMTRN